MVTTVPYLLVYSRPESLSQVSTHYCPGCTHGVAHRLIAEVLDEMGVRENTIGVAPVGCSVFAYNYFNCDFVEAAHGRAPAMATGIKRVLPDRIVFTYQGDGDLASIGMAEIMHAAARGENITVVFINNAIYGMALGLVGSLLGSWIFLALGVSVNGRRCRVKFPVGRPLTPRWLASSTGCAPQNSFAP